MANALSWYDPSKVIDPGAEAAGIGVSAPDWLTAAGNASLLDPAALARLGYSGDVVSFNRDGGQNVSDAFSQWMQQNGYRLTPDPSGYTVLSDAAGNELTRAQGRFNDPAFGGLVDLGVAAVLGTGLYNGLGGLSSAAPSGSLTGSGALDAYGAMDAAYGTAGVGGAEGALAGLGGTGPMTIGGSGVGGAGTISGGSGITGTLGGAGSAAGSAAGSTAGSTGGLLSGLGKAMSGNGLSSLIGNGLSLAGNLYASNKAGDALSDATAQANALQRYMYDTTRSDNMPALEARNNALAQIQSLLQNPGSITSDPGYAFGLNEGTKALNTGAASRGMTYSGAQQKALTRYGQDYAGTKLNESFNRLASLAGLGQSGAGTIANAGSNYANTVGSNTTGLGSAQASQYLLNGQNIGNAINGLTAYGQRNGWWGG